MRNPPGSQPLYSLTSAESRLPAAWHVPFASRLQAAPGTGSRGYRQWHILAFGQKTQERKSCTTRLNNKAEDTINLLALMSLKAKMLMLFAGSSHDSQAPQSQPVPLGKAQAPGHRRGGGASAPPPRAALTEITSVLPQLPAHGRAQLLHEAGEQRQSSPTTPPRTAERLQPGAGCCPLGSWEHTWLRLL